MAGPQCCSNPPELSAGAGAGHEEEIGGLRSYIAGSTDSKTAVLLVSDVFGYEAPKFRKLADLVAGYGFYVVVPDFLQGDYLVWGVTPVDEWLKKHGHDQGFEHAKPVIAALKSKGITKVGAAGFCWGAKVVVELSKYAYIDAAALCHPTLVNVEDIQAVKVPLMILGAEHDEYWPPEVLKTFEEALNAKPDVDGFVKIFPGVTHGWTVRYKDEDKEEVKLAEEAHQDLLTWFAKYLKLPVNHLCIEGVSGSDGVVRLLEACDGVKILDLSDDAMLEFVGKPNMGSSATFQNLTNLIAVFSCDHWGGLLDLIDRSVNLQVLELLCRDYDHPMDELELRVPPCFSSSLKHLYFWPEGEGHWSEKVLLKFILEHCLLMETLTLCFGDDNGTAKVDDDDKEEMLSNVLELPRASDAITISFRCSEV